MIFHTKLSSHQHKTGVLQIKRFKPHGWIHPTESFTREIIGSSSSQVYSVSFWSLARLATTWGMVTRLQKKLSQFAGTQCALARMLFGQLVFPPAKQTKKKRECFWGLHLKGSGNLIQGTLKKVEKASGVSWVFPSNWWSHWFFFVGPWTWASIDSRQAHPLWSSAPPWGVATLQLATNMWLL